VVAYGNADECAELIEHFLSHEREREAIARAGQRRTLSEHTYRERAGELLALVSTRV
jgi:spore maturation protein CgeB